MLAAELLQAKRQHQPIQQIKEEPQSAEKEPTFWKKKLCTSVDNKETAADTVFSSQNYYFTGLPNSSVVSSKFSNNQNSVDYIPTFPFIPPRSFPSLPHQNFENHFKSLYDFNLYNRFNSDKITATTANHSDQLKDNKQSSSSNMPQIPLSSAAIKTEITTADDTFSEYSPGSIKNICNNSTYMNNIRHTSGSSGSSGPNFISPPSSFIKSEIMSPNDHLKSYSRQSSFENNSFPSQAPPLLLSSPSSSFDSLKKMMQRFGSTEQRDNHHDNPAYQYFHLQSQQQQQQHMQQQLYHQKQLQQQYLNQMKITPSLAWSDPQSPQAATKPTTLPSLISISNDASIKSNKHGMFNYNNDTNDHSTTNKIAKFDNERFNSSSNDETTCEQETEKLFPCRNCSFIGSSKEDFEQHCREHFKFSCNMCNYKSKSEGRLKRHLKHSHNSEEKIECNEDNLNDQTVSSNEKLNESNDDDRATKFNLSSAENQTQQPNLPAVNDIKQLSVAKPPTTGNNKKTVKARPCKICGHITYTKNETYQHRITHFPNMFRCEMPGCQFATQHRHHFLYHIKGHNGEKQYKCSKCNYRCLTRSMLVSHEKCHSYVYRYRCSCCKFSAKHAHALTVHIEKWNHKAAPVLRPDGSLPVNDPSSNFENFVRKGRKQNSSIKQPREKTGLLSKSAKKDSSQSYMNEFNEEHFNSKATTSPGKYQYPDLLLLQQHQDKLVAPHLNQQTPQINNSELAFNYQTWFAELQNRGRQMMAEGLGRNSNANIGFMPQLPFNFNFFQSMALGKNPYSSCKCNSCGKSFNNALLLMNHVMTDQCRVVTNELQAHQDENKGDESFGESDNDGGNDVDDDNGEDTDKYTVNNDNRENSDEDHDSNGKINVGEDDLNSCKESDALDLTSKPKQPIDESSSIVGSDEINAHDDSASKSPSGSNNYVNNNRSRKSRRKGIAHKVDVNKAMDMSYEKQDIDELDSKDTKDESVDGESLAANASNCNNLDSAKLAKNNNPNKKAHEDNETFDKSAKRLFYVDDPKSTETKSSQSNQPGGHHSSIPSLPKQSPPDHTSSFEIDAQSRYHCPHCRIIFGDSRVYDIHMEFHDPDNPFKCCLCGRESKDGRDFFLHVAQYEHKLKNDW